MINRLLYVRKRRDRWWRYLELKDAFRNAQRGNHPEKHLEQVLVRLGHQAPITSLKQCWQALVGLGAERAPVLTQSAVRSLESEIDELDPRVLSQMAWLDLYHLGVGMGLYQPANRFRDKAIERAVLLESSAEPDAGQLVSGFYSHLELGDYRSASELLDRFPAAGCSRDQVEQAGWLLDLLSRQLDTSRIGFGMQANPEDVSFGDLVKGKTLALVGPVPSDVAQGQEIDQHDIVVKFSYRGGERGRNPVTQGRRVDVSYYNNTQADALANSDFKGILGAIEWGVCINRKGRRQFPRHQDSLRQITSMQWLLPDTHFNAGPNAVIDLLRFNPGGLKVFNTDLMLSAGRFAGYRPEGAKPIEYTRSFIKTHDPVLQYRTLHRLWELGYIGGDERFREVMEMGLTEYLTNLQKVHGADEQALL